MSATQITIRTDQGPRYVAPGTTLAELLHELKVNDSGIATAVNGQFVARHERASHVLHDGDAVLCFAPITGG